MSEEVVSPKEITEVHCKVSFPSSPSPDLLRSALSLLGKEKVLRCLLRDKTVGA